MGNKQKEVVPSPSKSARENSKEIPADLLVDIFSRLPLEDVARCRCVSKRWSCVLRRRDFTQLYLKVSSVRPRILFTFLHNGKRIFYSMHQDLDPDRDYPCPITPHYQMHFPKGLGSSDDVCPSILGFICSKSRKPMICNPSTGEYISLPVPPTTKRNQLIRPYFGYDPIDKLFKVLCMSDDYVCRVSTLGTGVMTWRRIECSIPHQPLHTELCIDGVLYYLAKRMGDRTRTAGYMVVCFDVKLEIFKFLDVELQILGSALINYKGNLGILLPDSSIICEGTQSFELRVLEDTDEIKWSTTVYILPFYWKYLVSHSFLKIAGMTSAGEIVLSTCFLVEPFEVLYYNIVKNTVVRIELDFGILDKKASCSRISTLINHVENVELIN